MDTRPYRFKGPFNIEFYDDGDPATLLFSIQNKIDEDLKVKAEPNIDEDEKGAKRVTHVRIECELPLGEFNPSELENIENTKKVTITYPGKGKTIEISGIEYCYASLDTMTPTIVFGKVHIGSDWISEFSIT
ncbi:MAG: hypothetical protein H0Z28_11180 [Archaeoglobus sp.]|nr:hypothetical protein [Archaeoglobus sp.]